ncbi:MAG: hypothetical protein Q7U53_15535 [Anaerolineaceae bacterium]|nr:hypothetical protein [Anaerolineaceae bacterium]
MTNTLPKIVLNIHKGITGRRILESLDDLNDTQWLSRNQLLSMQQEKLLHLVDYAYQWVPYYKRIFDMIGLHPKDFHEDISIISKLPILTKAIIRENWNDLITTNLEQRQQLSKLSTSGSTGTPLVFMQNNNFRDYVTAEIQHHMSYAGWKMGDLTAMIWGASYKPSLSRKLQAFFLDFVWNRFQINAFNLSDEILAAFTKRVISKKPHYLYGYATSIYTFAKFIKSGNYPDINFRGIFTTSEMLFPPMRSLIEETFKSSVFNRYGTVELGGIACECIAHSGFHINAQNNYIEIVDKDTLVKPGKFGDIIVTNLNNFGMPFIRYNTEDGGSWSSDHDCICGRCAPKLATIDGRLVDTFFTQDGKKVWSGFAGAGFKCLTHSAIKQFQIVQKSLDKILVRLVQESNIPQEILNEIVEVIQNTFGPNVIVDFEFPDQIVPLQSGKHQYAMSELNK